MKKKFLITGSLGQIGSELAIRLQKDYGKENVILTDLRKTDSPLCDDKFEILNVLEIDPFRELVKKHKVTHVIHLASLLSAVGEKDPQKLWMINNWGIQNVLELSRELKFSVFAPSSIAVFGPTTPMDNTPQDTIMRPTTIYGISKVVGELLEDYYHLKYGVDTRSVRFPGLISYKTLPGGGTTDYAVDIYYEAIKNKKYKSYIAKGTYMDMMYMPDAIDAIVQLIEADPKKLKHRNSFNITAMQFDPEEIAASIRKYIPEFKLEYAVDPVRQAIAESWPNSLDDSAARAEWGWKPKYDLDKMTKDMLDHLHEKLGK